MSLWTPEDNDYNDQRILFTAAPLHKSWVCEPESSIAILIY